jgi:hypothetical protein
MTNEKTVHELHELGTNYTKKHIDLFPQRRKGTEKKLYLKTLRLSERH